MRQSVFVLFIFGLFLFVIAYFPIDFSNRLQPELFISEDVLVVSKQFDFLNRMKALNESSFIRAINSVDVSMINELFPTLGIRENWLETVRADFETTLEHPLAVELFGQEFTLALFPTLASDTGFLLDTELKSNLLVISRPRHHARIIELFSGLIDRRKLLEEAQYGGYTIKRIPVENYGIISVVRVKDLILLSFEERILRRALNTYDNKDSLITNSTHYKETVKGFNNFTSLSYLNVERAHQLLVSTIQKKRGRKSERKFADNLENFSGYKSLLAASWGSEKATTQKAVIHYDLSDMPPQYKSLFDVIPAQPHVHQWIHGKSILFYWTNVLRPKVLLEMYKVWKTGDSAHFDASPFDKVSEITGHTAEKLLSFLDNDIAVAMKDSSTAYFIPFPRLLVAIKIKETDQLLDALLQLSNHYNIPLTKRTVDETELYLWGGVIAAEELQPSFAFTRNYLVISSNRQQIKEFITGAQDYESLEKQARFQQIDIGLTEKNNSITYIDIEGLTIWTKEIISWVGTMIAIQDRDAARKSKILIDQLINPLLDGMTEFTTVGIRSYVDQDTIVVESKILKDSDIR